MLSIEEANEFIDIILNAYFELFLADNRFKIVGNKKNKTVSLQTDISFAMMNKGRSSRTICDLIWNENRHELIEQAEAEYLLRNLEKLERLDTDMFNYSEL